MLLSLPVTCTLFLNAPISPAPTLLRPCDALDLCPPLPPHLPPVIILLGLAAAATAAYYVFLELFMEPRERTVADAALALVREDPRLAVRLGPASSITSYGADSRSRSARQVRAPLNTECLWIAPQAMQEALGRPHCWPQTFLRNLLPSFFCFDFIGLRRAKGGEAKGGEPHT